MNESEAARAVFVEAGERHQGRSALADEVQRLAVDEADRTVRARVMADMDAVAADWPA